MAPNRAFGGEKDDPVVPSGTASPRHGAGGACVGNVPNRGAAATVRHGSGTGRACRAPPRRGLGSCRATPSGDTLRRDHRAVLYRCPAPFPRTGQGIGQRPNAVFPLDDRETYQRATAAQDVGMADHKFPYWGADVSRPTMSPRPCAAARSAWWRTSRSRRAVARASWPAAEALPPGPVRLRFDFTRDFAAPGSGSTVTIWAGERQLGSGRAGRNLRRRPRHRRPGGERHRTVQRCDPQAERDPALNGERVNVAGRGPKPTGLARTGRLIDSGRPYPA